ncbi:hypothetical protein [Bacillus sp. 3255]|uniref:hypothetical protein n=1 Tax=Bacillus sp. 3255 TaxID=2817904 RepID=UPI002855B889|nr:hypothetical protein [Bacillus sp. 3255]MDR6879945.1 hypothetical protein [Bacillus sp. 3255]
MTNAELTANEANDYSYIIQHALTMELRVENTDVDKALKLMEDLGFKGKNSWASMQMSGHTVIEFWKKELTKS